SWFAFALDGAAVGFDDLTNGWQAESAAGWFGGEEDLKDFFHRLRRHSTPGIDDFQNYALALSIGLEFDQTSLRHRLLRILQQIRQHLFDQTDVHENRREVGDQMRSDIDP